MKRIGQLLLLLLIASVGYGQAKTHAFFMVGNYASPDWEKLAFDLNGGRQVITYSYQTNERGHALRKLSNRLINGEKAVLAAIPGTSKRYIILPDRPRERLIMSSEDGTYRKVFSLGYEGPVNGRGTYCATCANEPADAFRLVDAFIR